MPLRTSRVVTLSMAALAASLASLVVGPSPAWAGVGLGVTPEFPAAVTVGAAGVPASLRIVNTAFGGEGPGPGHAHRHHAGPLVRHPTERAT